MPLGGWQGERGLLRASTCPKVLASNVGSFLLSFSDTVSLQAGRSSLHRHPK